MIDDERDGQPCEHGFELDQLLGLHEDLYVPAESGDPGAERRQSLCRGHAPRLRCHEVHAQAADAVPVEPFQLGVGDGRIDDRDAAGAVAEAVERVDRAGVVDPVSRWRHDDGSAGAEP